MPVPKGCGAERRGSSAALPAKTITHGLLRRLSAGTTSAGALTSSKRDRRSAARHGNPCARTLKSH